MKKAILSKENCLKDIVSNHSLIWFVAFIWFIIPSFLVYMIFGRRFWIDILGEIPFLMNFQIISIMVGLICSLIYLFSAYKKRHKILQDEVFIVEEKLIGKDLKERRDRHGTVELYTTLVFPLYGEFKAYTRGSGCGYYCWSQDHKTGARGLYYDAEVGDVYYLVVSVGKKEKMLMVYSKEHFELVESDFKKRGERYYF